MQDISQAEAAGRLEKAVRLYADAIAQNETKLNEMDAILGDGEHGSNMKKCLDNAVAVLNSQQFAHAPTLLKAVGNSFLSSGGGTAATLFGMLFLFASAKAEKDPQAGAPEIVRFAYDSVQKRSQALPGDKTMIDALDPLVNTLESAYANGDRLGEALALAAQAAGRGAQATRDMIARRGRGHYVQERGLGVVDPGAMSVTLMAEAFVDAFADL